MENIEKNIIKKINYEPFNKISDINEFGENLFMFYCTYMTNLVEEGRILNKTEMDYLLSHTNFNQKNLNQSTPLMYALDLINANLTQEPVLTHEQWDYLFNNSNLEEINNFNINSALIFLYEEFCENININIIGEHNYQKLLATLHQLDFEVIKQTYEEPLFIKSITEKKAAYEKEQYQKSFPNSEYKNRIKI